MSGTPSRKDPVTGPLTVTEPLPIADGLERAPAALPSTARTRFFDFALVLLIGLFMCVYRIGDHSFGAGDQTTHTKVVQEMLSSGNLLNPTVNGKPYYNKPPFKMWLVAGVVSVFGESNFTYRVVDGLCGVAIGLLVFFFTQSLLRSRSAAYFALLTLYGCNLLFFGHGIRNATQDAMMLTLVTLTIVLGYSVIERVRTSDHPTHLYRWAFALGGLTGLAILTKNVAGLMAFIVLGLYALTQRDVVRKTPRLIGPALVALITSLLPFALYIYAQGAYRKVAWQLLAVSEVYKRATQGYHFVNRPWYYLEGIFDDGITAPPVLLAAALGFALWTVAAKRDRRYTLLLIWAIAPVALHSMMKSKLLWYVMPAIPAISILTGSLVATLLSSSIATLRGGRRLLPLAGLLFGLYGIGALGHHTYLIAHKNLEAKVRNRTDEIVEHALASKKGRETEALFFGPQKLAHHERLYWEMLTASDIRDLDYAALKARLTENPPDYLIASAEHFAEIAKLRAPEGYLFLKPKYRRRKWQAVIAYSADPLPSHFTNNPERHRFGSGRIDALYGLKPPAETPTGVRFRAALGPETALLLRGDRALTELGSTLTLTIASTVPAARGPLSVRISMNGEEVATLQGVREGFHDEQFVIPPKRWRSGRNVFSFRYFLPDGRPVGERSEPLLFHALDVRLGTDLQPSQ